jgi:vacuolar-type H+-ATPase subunit H
MHPSNLKKLAKAHRLGKGARLSLMGNELGDMDGGNIFKSAKKAINKGVKKASKAVNKGVKDIEKGANKYINQADKYVNKGINEIDKNAKKYVTEKNIGKYALKGYNAINNDYLPAPVLSDFSQFGM